MKATGEYNPDTYGTHRRPEGPALFNVVACYEEVGTFGPQMAIEVESVDPEWKRNKTDKIWCPISGFVFAMFDAMGKDPKTVDKNYEYKPEHFRGKQVACMVLINKKNEKYANPAKLYPAFNKKWTPEPVQAEPDANPGDDVPF
jgi:hypothetical protein